MKRTLIILILLSFNALSIEPMDNYYSHNIYDAVNQAKARPHHYDYSNTYRYKRTTAQSIELKRLNLEELEQTHLEISPPPAKKQYTKKELKPLEKSHALAPPKTDVPNITRPARQPINSQYQSQFGRHQAQSITSQGEFNSTPRP